MLGHSQTKMVDTTVNSLTLQHELQTCPCSFLDLRDLQVKCSLMEEHARLDRGWTKQLAQFTIEQKGKLTLNLGFKVQINF